MTRDPSRLNWMTQKWKVAFRIGRHQAKMRSGAFCRTAALTYDPRLCHLELDEPKVKAVRQDRQA
ncbi:hypothetical protein [Sporosarcina sp. P18a]|uniref:hypothetical protein n=1 Tax=Sporosarcina sp. P18a TaxID=2048259 RepID=UPI001181810E|nr:hypothetical protein [Sporosarcina sp. P18a]